MSAPSTSKSKAPAPSYAGRKSILVVEDDDAVRQMIARTFEQDYIVHQAADGLIASEMLAHLPAPPDLFILDVMMPRVDGFTLAKHLKSSEKLRGIPILFLTAKSMPGDVLQGIALGARHYMQKPFKMADLVDKVQRALK